jgi:uncharacterized repeat protein (TIGR03803 family)
MPHLSISSNQHATPKQQLITTMRLAATIIIAISTVASIAAHGQTFTTLYAFRGGNAGASPSNLILTPSGELIGTAAYGSDCPCYLTFGLSPEAKETVLHRFSVPLGNEAEIPGGYSLSKDGETLYGLSNYGGDYTACPEGLGCGFVFSLDLSTNKYEVLHEFQGGPNDGAGPNGNMVFESEGNLFGMAFDGGANFTGAIFEITSAGAEKIIYSFGPVPDGNDPAGGLVRDSSGNFFGATISGGTGSCQNGPGCGTVFEVTPSGKEKVLYSFTGGSDGQNPYWLVGNSAGAVYGISRTADNVVTAVFEVNSKGQFSIIYNGSFVSQITSLSLGPSGALYATATGGTVNPTCGDNGCGQVLQLTPDGSGEWTATVLHAFDGSDGEYVNFGVVVRNGDLYGATAYGGPTGNGTIFKLVP